MKYEKDDDAIATQSIELALIKFNGLVWGDVKQQLKKRHNSGFEICLEHPEYFKEILMEIFGDSYPKVIKQITGRFDKYKNERMESLIKTLLE